MADVIRPAADQTVVGPSSTTGGALTAPRRTWRKSKRYAFIFTVVSLVITTAVVVLFFFRVVVSIEAGHAGVIYRFFFGTETETVYRPGLHILQPWNTMVTYQMRKQTIDHSFTVLSSRGLPVQINLTVRFRPDLEQLGLLHQQIGPDYPLRVVLPQVESVLRRQLSSHSAEEIYTNDGGFLTEALRLARDEVGRNFVDADDIVIRSIVLPESVKKAIEAKIVQKELLDKYVFLIQTAEREAERLRIEGQGLRDANALLDQTLTRLYLSYETLRATEALTTSPNSRLLIVGGDDGLPFRLSAEGRPEEEAETGEETPAEADAVDADSATPGEGEARGVDAPGAGANP